MNAILLILTLFPLHQSECAKILGIFYVPGKSHHRAGFSLMEILANRGHEVTYVSPFKEEYVPKNFRSIVLDGTFNETRVDSIFRDIDNIALRYNMLTDPHHLHQLMTSKVEATLKHKNFQQIMNSGEKFDIVILEEFGSFALRYVARHFKAQLILYSGFDLNPFVSQYVGNPENPSYISHFHLPKINEMNFLDRVNSAVHYVISNIVLHYWIIPAQNEMLHTYFPESPDISDFVGDVSLALMNTDMGVNEPISQVPSMINIGGYHIKKPKPLPRDLQELLDKSKQGVIYFSFGSNLKSKFISAERKKLLINTFAKLNQTVFWKFEEDLSDMPNNIILRKWFPQNDILAHKNIKLFISHGGIYSMMESVYHGVPMLMFPMFGDQFGNVKRAEAMKFGKWMLFSDLKGDMLEKSIKELLENPEYSRNAQKRSRIFRDQPIALAEKINYWVEYVIRHKGAEHLKVSSRNLSLYQVLLLDVIGFILAIHFVVIMAVKYLISLVSRRSKHVVKMKQK